MDIEKFRQLATTTAGHYPLDEWSSRLVSVCGNFRANLGANVKTVTGVISPLSAGGLDFVQVANNLETIQRDEHDIRTDYGEHLFLLLQIEGKCGIEQLGRQTTVAPGDCALVDSSRPSTFNIGGRFSNTVSVHLPRQIFFSGAYTHVEVARRVETDDPMSSILRGLVAKLMKAGSVEGRSAELRELLFNATRYAFSFGNEELAIRSDCASHRIEVVQILIDRHLTEDYLSLDWLALRLGVSARTLQNDFTALGTTVNSLIRTRRLYYARDQLCSISRSSSTTIAEIAYNSGFNDISYFNRCFRKTFGCSPKSVIRH
jgi:AraC-like DNA-binding protein